MGLDRQVVASRLAALEEHLRLLGPLAALDLEAFTSDPRVRRRTATFCRRWPMRRVINRDTTRELTNLAGFRNLLVHDYTRVDRARVHSFLNTRLDGFRRFAADIAGFVASQPRDRV